MIIKSIKKVCNYDLDIVEKLAKTMIEECDGFQPFAILAIKDEIFFCIMKFKDDKDKQLNQDTLRNFVQKMNIKEYWIALESWISNSHIGRARDDVNRKKAQIILWFSIDKNVNGTMVSNTFERNNKKIKWKKRVVVDNFYSSWNFYLENVINKGCNEIVGKSNTKLKEVKKE